MPSKAHIDHHYMLMCKRRGYYAVGPLSLSTGDLFGFAEATWHEETPVHVTVYPQVVPLQQLGLPSRSPFGVLAARQRLFEDPNRMAGVRDYATGDSLRRIHWKASAHADTLLVKKFQPAIALNVTVVLDLNRRTYPLAGAIGSSEWAIMVAASVASYVVGQRQPVGLITNGLDSVSGELSQPIPMRQGQGQLITILTALARVQMHDLEFGLAEWLPRRIADLEWGATLVVIAAQIDEATLWMLHNAYRRGSNVVVLVVTAESSFDRLRAQGEKLGVHLYRTVWEKICTRFSPGDSVSHSARPLHSFRRGALSGARGLGGGDDGKVDPPPNPCLRSCYGFTTPAQNRSVRAMRWCWANWPSSKKTTSPCLRSTISIISSTASSITPGCVASSAGVSCRPDSSTWPGK